MQKEYETPYIDVVKLKDSTDVIVGSLTGEGNPNEGEGPGF